MRMRPEKIIKKLRQAVEEMESTKAERAAKEAVAAGTDPVVAITDGLARGMKTVSDLFDEGEAFIPQLLVAADAFETGADILTESMTPEGRQQLHQGKVLICTVQGDIHDIGKNIVKTMLIANGFEVIDLGRDVPTEEVVREAKQQEVDIIIGAALMRTTMAAQRDIVQAMEEEGLRCRCKCLFGGSPVSAEWVASIGGDAYAESAAQAVEQAKKLMLELRAATAPLPPAT